MDAPVTVTLFAIVVPSAASAFTVAVIVKVAVFPFAKVAIVHTLFSYVPSPVALTRVRFALSSSETVMFCKSLPVLFVTLRV